MQKTKAKKNNFDPVKKNDKNITVLKEMYAIMEKVQASETTHNKYIKEFHKLIIEVCNKVVYLSNHLLLKYILYIKCFSR